MSFAVVVKRRLAIVASHAIQYQAPLFRALAQELDLHVFYANQQSSAQQADAAFGVEFEWDVDLFEGYAHTHMANRAAKPSTQTFFGCDTPEITRQLESGRFDAVMTMGWYLRTYVQAIRACNRLRIPIMVRGDSTLQWQKDVLLRAGKRIVYPFLLRNFDAFLVVGQQAKAYLKRFGVAEERMFWSPHSVDNGRFRSEASRASNSKSRTRASLGCKTGEHLILFVGQFISRKRPLDLVKALALLNKKNLSIRGVFVGDGQLAADIRSLGRELNAPIAIVGFKNQSELPSIYGAADVFVLPSGRETWGLVVNEAMACGTPAVVSSGVGCSADLIVPGETGYEYPVGNVEDLAHAIRRLLPESGSERILRALEQKMSAYSYDKAVDGVVRAMHHGRQH